MTCPVPGCEAPDRPGMLMCRDHWYKASPAARRAVNKTWREYNDRTQAPEQRMMALKAYRVARDRAIKDASTGGDEIDENTSKT